MRLMNIIILIFGLLAFPSFAYGYWSEPDAPYCSNNVYDSWEANSYKDDIVNQITKWNQYAEEAIDYAKCKKNKLIN